MGFASGFGACAYVCVLFGDPLDSVVLKVEMGEHATSFWRFL